VQLGFLHFEVSDPDAWDRFLTGVLGLTGSGEGQYRNDEYAWRFQITEGPADDLAAIGWEFADDEELDAVLACLARGGHDAISGDASTRGCTRRYLLDDPGGVPTELVTGLSRTETPLDDTLVPGGFVASSLGLGHLVVTAPDGAATRAFYEGLLGFKLSDQITCEVYGFPVDLLFFHANPRHHSLAFGGPQRKRLHHFMLEARSIDDVGACYDRAIRAGVRITQTLGRHPNDGMFSYYGRTPSKFEFEFGHGGRIVDDATWETTTYDRISDWGHHPPQIAFAPKPRDKR
jgi:2,3-dihydroxybiphenyl 1,2-dioxygenase